MNKEQLRHAHSIARHVRQHSERLTRDMESIESIQASDVKDGYPVTMMKKRIETDVHHAIKKIQQVLTDMLSELEQQ